MKRLYNFLANKWIKKKTSNYTKIPLFTMVFDFQKFKENGKKNSCILYTVHPDIVTDQIIKDKLCEVVDYIRDTYDMEQFTKI